MVSQRLNFGAIFGPKITIFGYIGFTIVSHAHCKYFRRFGATLRPKICKNSGLWSFSQSSAGFPSVLVSMSNLATFRGVLSFGLRDPISRSFWVLKWFCIILVLHAHWELKCILCTVINPILLKCILIMCPKSPISGAIRPRVFVWGHCNCLQVNATEFHEKSILVQIMTCCLQAAIHYLKQS